MICGRYIVGCAVLLACGALGYPRAPYDLALQAIDAPPPDQETYGYLLPRLTAKYRPSVTWGAVADPGLFILTELDDVQDPDDPLRSKRQNRPSLSIVNPMDVLRQRLLLEIARKKIKENAERNREMLNNVGKRSQPRSDLYPKVSSSSMMMAEDKAYQTNAL